MNLDKPIKINSNLENEEHLSCGINSIASILYTIGYNNIDLKELNTKLKELDKELEFGGIYNIDILLKTIEFIKTTYEIDINYEVKEFTTVEELKNILEKADKYGLICYYALQGFIRISKHPTMEHAHFGVIYKYDSNNETIWASQSNNKADKLNCLANIDVNKFVESCNIINKLKINWGKYNKCKICVNRKDLETEPRCGKEKCKLGLSNTNNCLYKPTIGNKIILIG